MKLFSSNIGYGIYLVALHLLLGAMAYFFLRERLYLFLAVEFLLLLSLVLGFRFYRIFMAPTRLLSLGKAALQDGDFTSTLLPTPNAAVNQLVDLYNQMIERLRAERSSQQAQQYFLEQLIKAAPIGLVLLDFDGHIRDLNPYMKQLLAPPAAAEAANGGSTAALKHPLLTEILALDKSLASQTIILPGNRRYRVEQGSFIDRGFPRQFYIVQDMTRQLLAAEKEAYGKVIRMMAHEVNNSVGATNSLLQSLVDCLEETPADFSEIAKEYLPVVMERGAQMNRFMRHFADVIRLPAPNKQPCNLGQLLSRVATLFSVRCRDQRIVLKLELSPRELFANIDAALIEQVLINAIKNSIESIAGRGGEIRLRLREEPLGIDIADNGPGIAPALANQLFTPFFSSKQNGQGIGLTLSRDILEQHGARYELYTRDGLTTFSVFF